MTQRKQTNMSENLDNFVGLTPGQRHQLKKIDKTAMKKRPARRDNKKSSLDQRPFDPSSMGAGLSVAEQRDIIQREAFNVNIRLYLASTSLVSNTVKHQHLEERTNRVKFWKRRNALRDIRRLHNLNDVIKEQNTTVTSLRSQLENLEKLFTSLT